MVNSANLRIIIVFIAISLCILYSHLISAACIIFGTFIILVGQFRPMKTLFYGLAFTLILACTATPDQQSERTSYDSMPEKALWADAYILKYLDANKDRLTTSDGKPVTYMKDSSTRYGRDYAMVRIGHSFENHYVTNQWIFIDSLSKQIYEYDLPNDSLILWNRLKDSIRGK